MGNYTHTAESFLEAGNAQNLAFVLTQSVASCALWLAFSFSLRQNSRISLAGSLSNNFSTYLTVLEAKSFLFFPLYSLLELKAFSYFPHCHQQVQG